MLELFNVFIRVVNDDVSDNNNAVQNLQTYGRLIFNMDLCQEAAVAHFTIAVRNKLGFTVRGGTVRMACIRSRLGESQSHRCGKPINENEMINGNKISGR
jgi:hypothetical protein